jgi:CheY-like chemotaxis protein
MGFAVVEAACGDEAIVLFRERGPFDLVLTDLYYFDEITEPPLRRSDSLRDGIQFAKSVRRMKPDQEIAIHTGSELPLTGDLAEMPILKKDASDFLPELRTLLNRL